MHVGKAEARGGGLIDGGRRARGADSEARARSIFEEFFGGTDPFADPFFTSGFGRQGDGSLLGSRLSGWGKRPRR